MITPLSLSLKKCCQRKTIIHFFLPVMLDCIKPKAPSQKQFLSASKRLANGIHGNLASIYGQTIKQKAVWLSS
jgi:hypothetical protein